MEVFEHILFPFSAIQPGARVVLYGAGDVGQSFFHQLRWAGGYKVAAWVDKRWAGQQPPLPFAAPLRLLEIDFDYLVIALANPSVCAQVKRELTTLGISEAKIVIPSSCRMRYTICHVQDLTPHDAQDGLAFARLLAAHANLPWSEELSPSIVAQKLPAGKVQKPPRRRMAIVGTGMMGAIMADTIKRRCDDIVLHAVISRDMGRARQFAHRFGVEYAYDSCEALADDPAVDLVHIATPVSLHHSQTLLFLQHGKHVLCEKPFAVNTRQAEEMIAAAREHGLTLADGVWPRYLPMARELTDILASGRIGRVVCLRANLFYHGPDSRRLGSRELCGGISLENGTYLMALASLILGQDVREVSATGLLLPQGVDEQSSITLRYPAALAVFSLGMRGVSDRGADIYGEQGFIRIDNANEYKRISVFDYKGNLVEQREQQSGYEHEVRACLKAIEQGQLCPPEYPHQETLFTMRMLDAIRQAIGVTYLEDEAFQSI